MNRIRIGIVLGAAVVLLAVASSPAAAADVTFTVSVETEAGDAVGGATLTATWANGTATAETAANGKAYLDVPAGESVEITVDHPEYVRNSPIVIENATARDVSMTVHPIGEAQISVSDQDGPVEDATVTLVQDGTTVVEQHTADGSVDTGEIEAGDYELTVEKPGYYTLSRSIDVPAGEVVERGVEIERGSVTLQVNVTDPYFDPPRALEGITADVEGSGTVTTQSDGTQKLSVPVNTELTVSFTGQGYETVERTIETDESETTLDVALSRADTLSVTVHTAEVVVGQPAFLTVTDEYDDPVENATVLLDGTSVTETDADGWARVTIDAVGVHELRVEDESVTSNVSEIRGVAAAGTTVEETSDVEPPTETTTAPTGTTETGVPGFGPLVALIGVLIAAAVGLVGRRR